MQSLLLEFPCDTEIATTVHALSLFRDAEKAVNPFLAFLLIGKY
jgi:hypothetical protein